MSILSLDCSEKKKHPCYSVLQYSKDAPNLLFFNNEVFLTAKAIAFITILPVKRTIP